MNMTRSIAVYCVSFLYLLLSAIHVPAQKQLAPLPIKEAFKTFKLPMFVPIDLSPDGRLVTYTLHNTTRKAQSANSRSPPAPTALGIPRSTDYCDVWVTDISTGAVKNLTQGRGTSWGSVWSPNGKYLAFFSNREGSPALWVWERKTEALRKVSDATVRVRVETYVPRWTPDSKKLIISTLPKGMTLAAADAMVNNPSQTEPQTNTVKEPGSTVVLFNARASNSSLDLEKERIRQNNHLAAYAVDLLVVDPVTRETKRIAHKVVAENYWISPDGTNLAVLITKGRQSQQTLQALWDLKVISLANGQSRTLVSDFGSDVLIPISWSPNGKFLAYMTAGPKVKNDCWLVPVSGGEPRNLTPGDHPPFDATFFYRGPLWDAAGDNVYLLSRNSIWRGSVHDAGAVAVATIPGRTLRHILSHNGRSIWSPKEDNDVIAITRDDETKQEGFYKINLNTGKYEKIFEENKSYGVVPALKTDVSAGGRSVVYTSQSAAEGEDIWIFDTDLYQPKRVTHINPIFDRYVMGEGRIIEWRTLNGEKARGALLMPAGYEPGKRYPLIVYQYPGSMWSNYGSFFGFSPFASAVENWQFFATRGYAVLMPDVPAKAETYMRDIAAAVLPGVDKVIEMGIANPERLAVTGQSNGGYGVLSLIVQTNRFKAAVDRMGPGNLISQYTQMTENGVSVYMGEMVLRTGGSLWEKRDKFIENSPIFYFDRVQTPLLIIQGTADIQVMVARSDEVFVSLRFLGKDVEYARYAGEGHGVSEWSFANQVDYLNRVIAWFDLWLKN